MPVHACIHEWMYYVYMCRVLIYIGVMLCVCIFIPIVLSNLTQG